MATSGSIVASATPYDDVRLSWERTSYSIPANTSTITWKLELISGKYGRINSTAKKAWTVVVDGKEFSGTTKIGIANNATLLLASGSVVLAHDSQGRKSYFSLHFDLQFDITFSGEFISIIAKDGSGSLDTIPRVTTPTLSASSVPMGQQVTINTPRASSSFTHDLAYRLSEGDYVSIATGVATSYKWTVPDLAEHLPGSNSGNLTIRCITKSGGTALGEPTYVRLVATVPTTAAFMPTVSALTATELTAGLAAQFGAFIQGKSALTIKATAAGAKGSTIKSYKTTLSTGDTSTAASFTTPILTVAGSVKITTTVTDTRDRTATKSITINVLEYTKPEIQAFSAYRCDATGAAADDGEYIAVRYKYSVPELNGGNTARMAVTYKRITEETYKGLLESTARSADTTAKPTGVTFSSDYSYDLQLSVVDYFGAEAVTVTRLPSAEVILDIGADGESVAIGGTAEIPGFETKWPLRTSAGRNDLVLPASTDLNSLLVPNIYAGTANSGYVHSPADDRDFTLEVLAAGADGQLMQRATTRVPWAPRTYARFYESGAWGEWITIGFETNWQDATLAGGFSLYEANKKVQYRRSGGVVELKGVVKPASAIDYDDGWVTITTLPAGYRPGGLAEVNRVCQGGGNAIWLMRITTAGAVQFARYRDGSTAATAGTDVRLPFSVTFLADR